MKTGYFWPVYGEHNEVCFPFFPSRDGENVERALGVEHVPGSVILTDGYAAYASYAKKVGIAHALCWSHSRREFVDALPLLRATTVINALHGFRRPATPQLAILKYQIIIIKIIPLPDVTTCP